MRKRIYLAGPISRGDLLHNVQQADAAMLVLMRAGFAPFNPMLSVYAGGVRKMPVSTCDPETGEWSVTRHSISATASATSSLPDVTHEDWLQMDLAWVAVSDALLRLPGESVGADRETAYATSLGIPVFTDLAALIAHFQVAK